MQVDYSDFKESTKPLMRPMQVDAVRQEIDRLRASLSSPPHISNAIQGRGDMIRHVTALDKQIAEQAPLPYDDKTVDKALFREAALREALLQGMPTQEEMRKKPPGAVDKHIAWEQRSKAKLAEWKNIRLRLHAGGHLDERAGAIDVCNFERYRPHSTHDQLSMDNAAIPGKKFHLPEPGSKPAVVIGDEQKAIIQELMPDIAAKLAVLDSESRKRILEIVNIHLALAKSEEVSGDISKFVRGDKVFTEKELARNERHAEAQREFTKVANQDRKGTKGMKPEHREAARQRMQEYWKKKRAEMAAAKEKESDPEVTNDD